jgi:hypothetical protein
MTGVVPASDTSTVACAGERVRRTASRNRARDEHRSEARSAIGWGGVWRSSGWTERGHALGEPGRCKHRSGPCGERGAQRVPGAESVGAFTASSPIGPPESPRSESPIGPPESPRSESPIGPPESPRSESPIGPPESPRSESPIGPPESPRSESPIGPGQTDTTKSPNTHTAPDTRTTPVTHTPHQ